MLRGKLVRLVAFLVAVDGILALLQMQSLIPDSM
jgi:hypothetical protein